MDKAIKEESIAHLHNEKLIDEYEWLRDKNWPVVNSIEIIDYLNSENKKTENYFNKYTEIEEKIYKEIRSKVAGNDESYPIIKGGYNYYLKIEKEKEYPIYYRKSINLTAKEEVLLDINKMDVRGCTHHDFKVSPDHNLLSYSIDYRGQDKYKIITQNIEEPEITYEEIEGTDGNIIWDKKGEGFFYIKLNSKLRASGVYYHKLKSEQEEDKLMYEENDEIFELEISKTSDEKYLLITSLSSSENEVRYIDLTNNALQKKLFERSEGKIFIIDHKEGYFYIKSNDKGKNFRLSKVVDDNLYELDSWTEIIPHNESEYILDFSLSYKYLVVNKKIQGVTKIYVYDEKEVVKMINLEEEVYSASGILPTYDSEFVRVKYSSLITPTSILEYDFPENKIYERKVQRLNFEYVKEEYKYKMIHARAKDDELIPISIVYKSDKFYDNGTNPLYLYGYGSYGISISPEFSTNIITLVDKGIIFAIAHIRGGDDKGYEWYEKAKLLTKKLTFTDFITCAEELIEQNYTNPQGLIISGGSAGGMVVGYAINERPELFKAAILKVPFLDVLNTMLDEELPLTIGEFKEWGNPKNKTYYDYIKSYSPYENIKEQVYPAIYVTAGLNDNRVRYWESAKWVAKINDHNQGENPVILHTDMEIGHKGHAGRYEILREKAKEYTFILIETGVAVCEEKIVYSVEIGCNKSTHGICTNSDNIEIFIKTANFLDMCNLHKIEEFAILECFI